MTDFLFIYAASFLGIVTAAGLIYAIALFDPYGTHR